MEQAPTEIEPEIETTEVRVGDLVPGTVVAGRYRIGRMLGRGAMGQVVLAEQLDTDGETMREVATRTAQQSPRPGG